MRRRCCWLTAVARGALLGGVLLGGAAVLGCTGTLGGSANDSLAPTNGDVVGTAAPTAVPPAATDSATAPGSDGSFDMSGSPPALDPELEIESSFQVPVVTGQRVWSANPVSGRVALVDVVSLEVQTMPAGLQPTYLAAIDGDERNRAIVLNAGSLDATLFRDEGDGSLSQLQIQTHADANAWAISASGRWAIAWSDERTRTGLDPTEGLQDITVMDLSQDAPEGVRLSVGYRPKQLSINLEESRAYAVTEDGISVIELGATPALGTDLTLVTDDELLAGDTGTPVLQDVPLTSDGAFALVRFGGASRVKIVQLSDNQSQTLTLPGEVSDIDLAGNTHRAVAVIRETAQVAVFDLDAAFEDPSQVQLFSLPGETIGSTAVPDQGDFALLFTNATDSDRVNIFDTTATPGDEVSRAVALKAPVTGVFPSPEGSHAVALLRPEDQSERAGAFSVIPVTDALPPKIQGTEAAPFAVTLADTSVGLRGLVTVRDDATGIYAVYVIRMPSLQVDVIELSSPPLAAGIVSELGIGYVAQVHPEGRITFIDLDSGAPRTLTGFELAGRVVTGSAE